MKTSYKKIISLLLTAVMLFALAAGLAACTPEDNTGKYQLIYASGAYLAQGDEPETKYYAEGEEVRLAPSTTFTFSNYTFAGWSDGNDVYEGGATYVMPAHDVILRATWETSSITATSVGFDGDDFVFSGTVKNVQSLYVYLNNTTVEASIDNYVQAEITDGTFTARMPLATLVGYNKNNTPFNLRYRIDSTTAELNGVEKGELDLSQTYNHDEYAYRLAVNSGTGCVAVYYEPAPDETVSVSAASVAFEDEYFVVTGSVENVTALKIYLTNTNVAASTDNYVQAEISGGTFTARLPLDKLIEFDVASNIPFNLRYRANDSKINVNIPQGSLDITATHTYGGKDFRIGVNGGCVALYYAAAPVPPEPGDPVVSAASVGLEDENFVFTGTVENVDALYVYLNNTGVSASMDNYAQAEITDGAFTVSIPLSTLIGYEKVNTPFNLRYKIDATTADINGVAQGALDLSATHTYGGYDFRLAVNSGSGCVAVYYAATPVPPDPDYSFTVQDMRFENGKFIVEGICGDGVEKLIFHLHNTNSPVIDFTSAATIADGKFKAEFVLDEIKRVDDSEPPTSFINVRYELNDDGYNSLNLLPSDDSYTVGQEYRYGEKTWTLKADSTRTYLNWSAVTEKYRFTEIKLELVDGKPTLTIKGTTTDEIAADQLKLLLDKNKGTTEQKYIENSETTASTFTFIIDLSDLISSVNATAASDQQAYFIRLYNGGTKIADINSRWASDLLWERGQIETDDAVYFLMKNTEWTNTAWNTLGICKFDK